jgi:hypothetical protein
MVAATNDKLTDLYNLFPTKTPFVVTQLHELGMAKTLHTHANFNASLLLLDSEEDLRIEWVNHVRYVALMN